MDPVLTSGPEILNYRSSMEIILCISLCLFHCTFLNRYSGYIEDFKIELENLKQQKKCKNA